MSIGYIIGLIVVGTVLIVFLLHWQAARSRRRVIREAMLKELRRKSLETFNLEEFARETEVPVADAKRVSREIYRDFFQKCASDGVLININ